MHKVVRVAIYVRVSTGIQDNEMQRRELQDYAAARGWTVVEVYEDKMTGRSSERPSWKRIMVDAKQRKFDVLFCWKLDRAFRSLKGMVMTLAELTEVGVQFVSLRDHIDLTTASGRLMTHIVAAFAEFEADIIRERVRAGIQHAKAKGTRLGRPQKRPNQARLASLKASGASLREIGRQLGLSKSGVQRALAAGVPKTIAGLSV